MERKTKVRGEVAFLGGGNMAEALIRGMLAQKVCKPGEIIVSDVSAERLALLEENFGVTAVRSNAAAAAAAETVVVAVKPGYVAPVLKEAAAELEGKLVISIAAGVAMRALRDAAPGARFVRVMPNTPALVGAGVSVVYPGEEATGADRKRALELLVAVGHAVEITQEALLDAVTGLSGSGPAFVFLFIEALADGGVKAGLPRALALELAAQTVMGSAKLALETGKHPGELKDMVTSPGGTTIAGVSVLEEGAFRGTVLRAVEAAAKRSKELGNG